MVYRDEPLRHTPLIALEFMQLTLFSDHVDRYSLVWMTKSYVFVVAALPCVIDVVKKDLLCHLECRSLP